jgi:hypothetical protein
MQQPSIEERLHQVLVHPVLRTCRTSSTRAVWITYPVYSLYLHTRVIGMYLRSTHIQYPRRKLHPTQIPLLHDEKPGNHIRYSHCTFYGDHALRPSRVWWISIGISPVNHGYSSLHGVLVLICPSCSTRTMSRLS